MSNTTSSTNSPDIADIEIGVAVGYFDISMTALYVYDYVITLPQEINIIWARKWTLSTWIYVANRYSSLLNLIFAITLSANNYQECVQVNISDETLTLVQSFVSALFTALRGSALCDRNIWLFIVIFALSIFRTILNLFSLVHARYDFQAAGGFGCAVYFPFSARLLLILDLTGIIAASIADAIVLVVTLRKTLSTVREAKRHHIQAPLAETLLRDGILVFLALLVINVLSVIFNNVPPISAYGITTPLQETLSPILIAHFILNLRNTSPGEETRDIAEVSTIRFYTNKFIGNMGESLRLGWEDSEDDYADEAADQHIVEHAADTTESSNPVSETEHSLSS